MQTSFLNNTHSLAFKTAKKRIKNKIPTSEENAEAFALFAGICKSEKFTIDAAYQAFSGVVRKKERLSDSQNNTST